MRSTKGPNKGPSKRQEVKFGKNTMSRLTGPPRGATSSMMVSIPVPLGAAGVSMMPMTPMTKRPIAVSSNYMTVMTPTPPPGIYISDGEKLHQIPDMFNVRKHNTKTQFNKNNGKKVFY